MNATHVLDTWQERGLVPHYFGLGFIQVKLDSHRRVHFWVPDWPTIPGAESELHGHRYDFMSTVLQGQLVHELFVLGPVHADPDPDDLEVVEVACQPGLAQEPQIRGYAAGIPVGQFPVSAGQQYRLSLTTLHRAHSQGPTVTLVERQPTRLALATVGRPQGGTFSCPFSLPVSADRCWDQMRKMVAGRVWPQTAKVWPEDGLMVAPTPFALLASDPCLPSPSCVWYPLWPLLRAT